jgi:hypothetical protein
MHEKKPSFQKLSSPIVAFLYEALATNALGRLVSALALGVGMTSCVPAKSYDEARTAAETEFTSHGRTRARLEAAHERIRALEQTLAERERALETGESSVAEAKLETIVVGKDKEAALELVEQLRSELARTGNHLSAYSDEKRDLARALMIAEERVRDIEAAEKNLTELVATARDLSLALGSSLSDQGIEIGARDGQIVLAVPASKLFAEGSDALVVDAAPVLSAVGKVSAEHPRVRVVLGEPDKAALGAERIQRLGAALRDRGVPEARLVLPSRASSAATNAEPTTAPVAIDPAPAADATETTTTPVPAAAPAPAPAPVDDASVRYEIGFAL